MLAAQSGTFSHNASTTTTSATANSKRPLYLTFYYSNGTTPLPNTTVYLDSYNGETLTWNNRASAVTDANGLATFSAWPTTQPGEQYRARLSNGDTAVPVTVADTSSGSSSSWISTITAPVQYGNLSARLRKTDGTDSPINSSSSPRFKLYTPTPLTASGANPSVFSNVPVGTYLLEGYQTGTFWGEEFWNSQQFTVVANATANAVLTRQYPYVKSVVMVNTESGATITAGQTVTAGTRVRFDVTVQNDVPNTTLSAHVHLVADFGKNAPYDYDWGTSTAHSISGNGGQSVFSFTTAFDAHTTGQIYYALEVFTDINSSQQRTDSWDWTQGCNSVRISKITGSVNPPIMFAGNPATPVFLQRYPAGTTALIDPNLRTWIIIHGRIDASTAQWVINLAQTIATNYTSDQVLLLDWSNAAASPGISTSEEDWIPPIAAWAAGKLQDYGFAGSSMNLIGHSWGGNMSGEIAKLTGNGVVIPGVNTIVALDPAENGLGLYDPEGSVNFRNYSKYSWAFHSSLLGSESTPVTAHEAFIVDTHLNLVLGDAHNAVRDIFIYILKHSGGGVSQLFKLDRLLLYQAGPWAPNLFTTSFQQGAAFETPTSGYEGYLVAANNGLSPNALYYTNFSSQLVVQPEYIEAIPPTISTFSVSPNSVVSGNAFTINYTVSDSGGSGLYRMMLRRTSGNGSASDPGWQDIQTNILSGNGPVSGSFTDTPTATGTYWYGMIVFDNALNHQDERQAGKGPTNVTVTLPPAATPTITPNGGSYYGSVQITLACSTSGAFIYYTTDGTTPTTSSTSYQGPFALSSTATVKAKAFASGFSESSPASANFSITPLTVVTVQSGTPGCSFSVDSTNYTSAQVFSWVPGSSHNIATTTPQAGGTNIRYVWNSWSDSGAISHTVAPAAATTFTANFTTQYLLTMTAGAGGSVSPSTRWTNSGTAVAISCTPSNGFTFNGWSGSGAGSYSGSSASSSVTVNGPVFETAVFLDTNKPTIVITAPSSGQRWSNTVFTVTGTASDNVQVASVVSQLNGAGWTPATPANGWSSWTAAVNLTIPGTNILQAYAVDSAGNQSTTASVSFVYVASAPLQVQTVGNGTISPNYSNSVLEIGKSYSMTAAPGSGFTFVNWTGSQTTNGTTLAFLMASNLSFTANFADTNKPTITVTAPTAGQRWSNAVFTASGTATDNWQVASVQYQLNGGTWTSASGTTNWSATLSPIPGTNLFSVFSADSTGNQSATTNRSFVYVVSGLLQIQTIGLGTISPNYSNAVLEIGKSYSVTSTPAAGFKFVSWVASTNWLGGVASTNRALAFTMAPSLTLQATLQDTNRPTLTVTTPTANQKMTNALAKLTGTASDNWKVTGVWYQLNSNVWNLVTTANNFANWTNTVTLIAGTNTLKFYALDLGGNYSATNSLSIVSSNTFNLQLAFTNALPMKTNGLVFSLQLSKGLNGQIQVSTNLINWSTLTNFVGTNTTLNFRDSAATNSSRRFYRAVIP